MAVAVVRGAVDPAVVEAWRAAIDAHPAWRRDGSAGSDFNSRSSSLRAATVAALDLGAIAAMLLAGPAGVESRERLGEALNLDLDQCWVRRQYALSRIPPGHAPHRWHQDGALGFDFLGATPAEAGLLAMVTCWIALTPCGKDAPGIEFVGDEHADLLPLSALDDAEVCVRHPGRDRLRPMLDPGDALVFGGGVLHHTHVDATMTRDRTSLELRFFPAGDPPPRLRGDRFIPCTDRRPAE